MFEKLNVNFRMARQRQLTEAERQELPSSLFLLSGTNPFRRAAIWISRWIVFEWIIILTIIGKSSNNNNNINNNNLLTFRPGSLSTFMSQIPSFNLF
jgi:hypothetical protein